MITYASSSDAYHFSDVALFSFRFSLNQDFCSPPTVLVVSIDQQQVRRKSWTALVPYTTV